jgi:translation initiation factor 4G
MVIARILNKLTPEKFDLLKGQLIEAGITTADILKVCLFLVLYILLSLMLSFLAINLLSPVYSGCYFSYI